MCGKETERIGNEISETGVLKGKGKSLPFSDVHSFDQGICTHVWVTICTRWSSKLKHNKHSSGVKMT